MRQLVEMPQPPMRFPDDSHLVIPAENCVSLCPPRRRGLPRFFDVMTLVEPYPSESLLWSERQCRDYMSRYPTADYSHYIVHTQLVHDQWWRWWRDLFVQVHGWTPRRRKHYPVYNLWLACQQFVMQPFCRCRMCGWLGQFPTGPAQDGDVRLRQRLLEGGDRV